MPAIKNALYCGDSLDILRNTIPSESIDLCYIDPPFNSKRDYFYNNQGSEEHAQAFADTWEWEDEASGGYAFITDVRHVKSEKLTIQTVELIKGLHNVLGKGSLLAYLISMTLRIAEIHRALKATGSLYLHCDTTASHYLKLILDSIFCSRHGRFLNEIIWHYTGGGRAKTYYSKKHDSIFWYAKGKHWTFNADSIRIPYKKTSGYARSGITSTSGRHYSPNPLGTVPDTVWDMPIINPLSHERCGYPTQKPEALLERIILSASNPGDLVADFFCGSGTTAVVAERLGRRWIACDKASLAVAATAKRLGRAAEMRGQGGSTPLRGLGQSPN